MPTFQAPGYRLKPGGQHLIIGDAPPYNGAAMGQTIILPSELAAAGKEGVPDGCSCSMLYSDKFSTYTNGAADAPAGVYANRRSGIFLAHCVGNPWDVGARWISNSTANSEGRLSGWTTPNTDDRVYFNTEPNGNTSTQYPGQLLFNGSAVHMFPHCGGINGGRQLTVSAVMGANLSLWSNESVGAYTSRYSSTGDSIYLDLPTENYPNRGERHTGYNVCTPGITVAGFMGQPRSTILNGGSNGKRGIWDYVSGDTAPELKYTGWAGYAGSLYGFNDGSDFANMTPGPTFACARQGSGYLTSLFAPRTNSAGGNAAVPISPGVYVYAHTDDEALEFSAEPLLMFPTGTIGAEDAATINPHQIVNFGGGRLYMLAGIIDLANNWRTALYEVEETVLTFNTVIPHTLVQRHINTFTGGVSTYRDNSGAGEGTFITTGENIASSDEINSAHARLTATTRQSQIDSEGMELIATPNYGDFTLPNGSNANRVGVQDYTAIFRPSDYDCYVVMLRGLTRWGASSVDTASNSRARLQLEFCPVLTKETSWTNNTLNALHAETISASGPSIGYRFTSLGTPRTTVSIGDGSAASLVDVTVDNSKPFYDPNDADSFIDTDQHNMPGRAIGLAFFPGTGELWFLGDHGLPIYAETVDLTGIDLDAHLSMRLLIAASGGNTSNALRMREIEVRGYKDRPVRLAADIESDAALIGHWPLENDTNAVVGVSAPSSNNVAFDHGDPGPTQWINNAAYFNGVDSWAEMGSQASVVSGGIPIATSLGIWFRPRSLTSSDTESLFDFGGTAQGIGIEFVGNGTTSMNADLFGTWRVNSFDFRLGLTNIQDTAWHHVMMVTELSSGSTYNMIMYLDGVETNRRTVNTSGFGQGGDLGGIGALLTSNTAGDTQHFGGWLRDFRIYNRPLTPVEVLALYEGTAPDGTLLKLTRRAYGQVS